MTRWRPRWPVRELLSAFRRRIVFDRVPLLLRILPYFVAFQRCRLLRLQSDDDEMALHFVTDR